MTAPKLLPEQSILGPLYEQVDEAVAFLNCVYHAGSAKGLEPEDHRCFRQVLDEAIRKLTQAKSTLHDLVEWAD